MLNSINRDSLIYLQLKFLLIFVAVYGVFQGLYFLIPYDILQNVIYHYGIVGVSADILNIFTNENVSAVENKLTSSKAILVIIRGCDGTGSLFLLCAAIIAFSATIKHKLYGLIIAALFLYAVNQIRIIGLYFVVAYQRDLFLLIHTYFAPTLIIAICALFFAWWIHWSKSPDAYAA